MGLPSFFELTLGGGVDLVGLGVEVEVVVEEGVEDGKTRGREEGVISPPSLREWEAR